MYFKDESEFEQEIINQLQKHGWKGLIDHSNPEKGFSHVLNNINEQDLIENWKKILFYNNRDKLNDIKLTDEEMDEVIRQIQKHKDFYELNTLITNEFISIKRTFNKPSGEKEIRTVQLRIFSKHDIGKGNNIYQIARQITATSTKFIKHRADLMLLFNGMPLVHIELKNHKPINDAIQQIKNYADSGFYNGIFKLVQIVVAMKPNEMLYLPNTTKTENIKKQNFLKWANKDNEVINDYSVLIDKFFSIPTVHKMIADYTIADKNDMNLKILRSYQVHAVEEIRRKFERKQFFNNSRKIDQGGFVWHSTGSGKTLTSFKLATLILQKQFSDIVFFVADRIELVNQTSKKYDKWNPSKKIEVKVPKTTKDLIDELREDSISHKIIITSIHKLSKAAESLKTKNDKVSSKIASIRKTFIFDEAHRSTSGDMLNKIRSEFKKNSVIFGFTGTPILTNNTKEGISTQEIFGSELHNYKMSEAIKDNKVLKFYCQYRFLNNILAPRLEEIQKKVDDKIEINEYNQVLNEDPKIIELEEKIFTEFEKRYNTGYKKEVAKDILKQWKNISDKGFYSAIFTVKSITSAIKYFEIFRDEIKKQGLNLKITALFDDLVDSSKDDFLYRVEAKDEILKQYNQDFNANIKSPEEFKKDIQERLEKKRQRSSGSKDNTDPYQLDLLIVVYQLLTGYDSKYINTVYFDRVVENEHLIQAVSRTNRIENPNFKPHGNIVFYNRPHYMHSAMMKALKLYDCGDPKMVDPVNIEQHLNEINANFNGLKQLFIKWDCDDFNCVPDLDDDNKDDFRKFLEYFNKIRYNLNIVFIHNFSWEENKNNQKILLNEEQWELIKFRYKNVDWSKFIASNPGQEYEDLIIEKEDIPTSFHTVTYETYIQGMDDNFSLSWDKFLQKYKRQLITNFEKTDQELAKDCLKKMWEKGKSFDIKDCVKQKQRENLDKEINEFTKSTGVNIDKLKEIINDNGDINKNNQLTELIQVELTYEVKKYIAQKLNRKNIENVKPVNLRELVKEFIKECRAKKAKILT
ncbi:HsdR family type I site-specific deoxyribonuclease [Mesomycoplasma ovipneumoniae]|uniref:HsdR family type I site-specific deoxyribonuclease n=1 Tax=Mesomycoplasma ovipneumoniae TaxID=29562 RepID=UPI00311AE2B3